MKFLLFFFAAFIVTSCAGNKTKNDRMVASIPQTKIHIKKIHAEKQEIDVQKEIKNFMKQLIVRAPYKNEYDEKIKKYLEKENVFQSEWESILWFVENSDTLSVENGYHMSSSIYLVRQSLGEGFNHGHKQTMNVVAKVKVELGYNYFNDANEIKNGDATITFLGFVNQVPLKLSQN